MSGRLLVRATAVGVMALAALVGVVPAQAHTELVGGSPAQGSEVSLHTTRLLLEFEDDVLPAATDVVVRGPGGSDPTTQRPEVSGSEVIVPVLLARAGRYDVTYRVVGRDGHVVTGSLWFTAAADGAPPSAAAAVPPAGLGSDTAATGASSLSWRLWWLPAGGLFLVVTLLRVEARRQQRTVDPA